MTPDRLDTHPPKDGLGRGPATGQRYLPALLVPLLLGLYLVLTSTADLVPGLGEYDEKRLIGVFLFLALASLALLLAPLRAGFAGQAGRAPAWFWLALGVAFLLAVASALRFPLPRYGLAEPAMLSLIVIGVLIVAASRQLTGELFDRVAMLIVAALGLSVAIQEWAGIAANWALGLEFEYQNMLVRFSHPRFYNHLQTWSMPVLAALPLLFGGSRKLKTAAIALLGLQWCILLVSGSRGSTHSIMLALTLTAVLRPRGRSAWLTPHLAGFLVVQLLRLMRSPP